MTPLERLLAETIPTRPTPPPRPAPLTNAERDDNWRTLCNAVGTPGAERPTRPALRLIDTAA